MAGLRKEVSGVRKDYTVAVERVRTGGIPRFAASQECEISYRTLKRRLEKHDVEQGLGQRNGALLNYGRCF
jgi:hypothetical protein